MGSQDAGFAFTRRIGLGPAPWSLCPLGPRRLPAAWSTAVCKCDLLLSRLRAPRATSERGFPAHGIRQGGPVCLFLEKTVSVLSYSSGMFHSYFTSRLGNVGLRVLRMSPSCSISSASSLHLRWPCLCFCQAHFHLSSSRLETLWLK